MSQLAFDAAGEESAVIRVLPVAGRRPGLGSQVVPRDDLVKQLVDQPHGQVVVVTAPAGYGKTTTVALWDERDERPFAWVGLDPRDDDPVHLVGHVAQSLTEIEPLDASVVRILIGPGRSVELDMLPALGWGVRDRAPFVLVLDDVHFLRSDASWSCIEGLAGQLPPQATLVLVGRSGPAVGLARRRMSGTLFELTSRELAMGSGEAAELLDRAGLHLDASTVDVLVERTEGWPGGLHLAALALTRRGLGSGTGEMLFSGRDRLVADYLVEEVLARSTDELQQFMLESSVLDRMSAALLDDLLDTDTSGRRLDELERSGNLFLVPLDDEREWYRYHHLFGDMLRARLRTIDPQRAAALHARASTVLEARRDIDGAVRHAVSANDLDRAADLVLVHGVRLAFGGRVALLGQWMELLGPEVCERHPSAIAASAWLGLVDLDFDRIGRAMAAAVRVGPTGPLADGSPSLDAAIGMVRALLAADGLDGVLRDTDLVRASGAPDHNVWWAPATLMRGSCCLMLGRHDEARSLLLDGLAHLSDSPPFEAATFAQLALLDVEAGDLAAAVRSSERALALAERHHLEGVPIAVSVYFIGAFVAARVGQVDEARRLTAVARSVLARMGEHVHRTVLFGNLLLAKAALALGDVVGARALAHEADRARQRDASATDLVEQLDALRDQIDDASTQGAVIVSPLTPAEVRVLPYLATHLSLQEIAEALVISRNTAKTHSVAIYRKLGVSSRSDAVREARRLGLITDPTSA